MNPTTAPPAAVNPAAATPASASSNAAPGSGQPGSGQLRLALKSEISSRGYVDGGWWPRSRDLQAELPDLLAALRDRLGPIESVTYHLGEWSGPPLRMADHGDSFRISGYRLQPLGSIDVIARKQRATLLVVDPDAPAQLAKDALAAAADETNAETVPALLTRSRPAENTTQGDSA
ncbi:MAG TPA: DUF5994 family protein [Pseudonocardia sp.]|nr:DUF5994 family protein [Pseudonocardia sp.]